MFSLPPSWDPLPGGPITPVVTIGLPLMFLGLFALLACAAIVCIDLASRRAPRSKTQAPEPSATRSDTVIAIGSTVPHAAAGGRR